MKQIKCRIHAVFINNGVLVSCPIEECTWTEKVRGKELDQLIAKMNRVITDHLARVHELEWIKERKTNGGEEKASDR